MKKEALLVAVILMLVAGAFAGIPPGDKNDFRQDFSRSAVLLVRGDTVHGSLTLYRDLDMVVVTDSNRKQLAFSAGQVSIFAVQGSLLPAVYESRPFSYSRPSYEPPLTRTNRRRFVWPLEGWNAITMKPGTVKLPVLLPNQHLAAERTTAVRVFRSFLWDHDQFSSPSKPAFFEQLSNGPFVLLRRQRLELTAVKVGNDERELLPVITDFFYLANPAGHISRLRQPKKDLLTAYQPFASAIAAYAAQHQLGFDNSADLGALVTYANTLVRK